MNCEQDVFPDAITSVGILLSDKAVRHSSVKFYTLSFVAELSEFSKLRPISNISYDEISPRSKWLPYFREDKPEMSRGDLTRLYHFGRFRRGIVTGVNEFFVLKPTTTKFWQMNSTIECVPCITRSSQIKKPVFDVCDFDALFSADRPILLFSVGERHSESAKNYIKFGETRGYHKRYLAKSRKP